MLTYRGIHTSCVFVPAATAAFHTSLWLSCTVRDGRPQPSVSFAIWSLSSTTTRRQTRMETHEKHEIATCLQIEFDITNKREHDRVKNPYCGYTAYDSNKATCAHTNPTKRITRTNQPSRRWTLQWRVHPTLVEWLQQRHTKGPKSGRIDHERLNGVNHPVG